MPVCTVGLSCTKSEIGLDDGAKQILVEFVQPSAPEGHNELPRLVQRKVQRQSAYVWASRGIDRKILVTLASGLASTNTFRFSIRTIRLCDAR